MYLSTAMVARILVLAILFSLIDGCSPLPGVHHMVQEGQTLFAISRVYGVDASYVARLNGIDDPSRLRPGQRLFIPSADRQRKVPVTVGSAPASAALPTAPPTITAKAKGVPPSGTSDRTPAPNDATPMAKAGKGAGMPAQARKGPVSSTARFVWPVQGNVVRSYGRKGNQACQGVEIATPAGTPVLSAAAGRVTYSGNAIRGYGHLVIVRHDDDFFTVYGFNQKSLVETGAAVRQGQRIALSGVPPGGGAARLHFEIRQGKSPVNPIFYLP